LFDYLRSLNAKHYNFTIEDVVILSDLIELFCPKVQAVEDKAKVLADKGKPGSKHYLKNAVVQEYFMIDGIIQLDYFMDEVHYCYQKSNLLNDPLIT